YAKYVRCRLLLKKSVLHSTTRSERFSGCRPGFCLARGYAQSGHGLRGREADGKSIVPATTDYRSLIANFSHPNHALRIYKHFLTLHIFKHDELHVSSSLSNLTVLNWRPNITQNPWNVWWTFLANASFGEEGSVLRPPSMPDSLGRLLFSRFRGRNLS